VVKERKERQRRNPRTGESITIAAKRDASFRPGKELTKRLAQDETAPTTERPHDVTGKIGRAASAERPYDHDVEQWEAARGALARGHALMSQAHMVLQIRLISYGHFDIIAAA
jgi:hypothetical protein